MQGRHQRQPQGPLGQAAQPVTAKDGAFEQFGPPLGIVGVQAAQLGNVGVPTIHETADLTAAKGSQHRLGKARQPPRLLLVGIGTAGDQHPAAGERLAKVLDRLLDLLTAAVGLGHLVQAIEQEQSALLEQFSRQGFFVIGQGRAL